MDGLKNTLSVLGSVILVLFIAFCIGMCTNGFRNKVYDVMDVVPESEYLSLNECNSMLIEEMTEQENIMIRLTGEKATLEATILQLQDTHEADELTIANYQTQVDILTIQIAEANTRITQLREEMTRISTCINNATIVYRGQSVHIEYPVFDDNDNYIYSAGSGDSEGTYWQYYGQDFINEWNGHFVSMFENIQKAINDSRYRLRLTTNDIYSINIGGYISNMHCNGQSYLFTNSATVDAVITLDGTTIDPADVINSINARCDYRVTLNFNHLINADNQVTSCVMEMNITTL